VFPCSSIILCYLKSDPITLPNVSSYHYTGTILKYRQPSLPSIHFWYAPLSPINRFPKLKLFWKSFISNNCTVHRANCHFFCNFLKLLDAPFENLNPSSCCPLYCLSNGYIYASIQFCIESYGFLNLPSLLNCALFALGQLILEANFCHM
jgi:hypothetical protein